MCTSGVVKFVVSPVRTNAQISVQPYIMKPSECNLKRTKAQKRNLFLLAQNVDDSDDGEKKWEKLFASENRLALVASYSSNRGICSQQLSKKLHPDPEIDFELKRTCMVGRFGQGTVDSAFWDEVQYLRVPECVQQLLSTFSIDSA